MKLAPWSDPNKKKFQHNFLNQLLQIRSSSNSIQYSFFMKLVKHE